MWSFGGKCGEMVTTALWGINYSYVDQQERKLPSDLVSLGTCSDSSTILAFAVHNWICFVVMHFPSSSQMWLIKYLLISCIPFYILMIFFLPFFVSLFLLSSNGAEYFMYLVLLFITLIHYLSSSGWLSSICTVTTSVHSYCNVFFMKLINPYLFVTTEVWLFVTSGFYFFSS